MLSFTLAIVPVWETWSSCPLRNGESPVQILSLLPKHNKGPYTEPFSVFTGLSTTPN